MAEGLPKNNAAAIGGGPVVQFVDDVKLEYAAKSLFFAYRTINDISNQLNIPEHRITHWRKTRNWPAEREVLERALIEDGFAERKLTVSKLTNLSVTLLEKGLVHLMKRTEPPSLAELEKLSLILANLDKITRLDSNKSTENIAVIAKAIVPTREELRMLLAADPMA